MGALTGWMVTGPLAGWTGTGPLTVLAGTTGTGADTGSSSLSRV
jgi:hypothetical protein